MIAKPVYTFFKNFVTNFPIRANLFIAIIFILFLFYFSNHNNWLLNSDFKPIIFGMFSIVFCLCIILFILSFTCVFLSYFYYKKILSKNKNNLQIQFINYNKLYNSSLLNFILQPVITLLIGDIQASIWYNNEHCTEKFSILKNATTKGFILKIINSCISLNLPNIQEYTVHKGTLYFQDLFKMYSIPLHFETNCTILNLPNSKTELHTEALPKKATETQVRIEQLRRVDGEMLLYKKFDNSDDTRRIVWKIFAKNRELVVRTPEIFNPYASQIYLYASFYNSFQNIAYQGIFDSFLNMYKNKLSIIYETLANKNFEIKYNCDQEINYTYTNHEVDKINAQITLSNWQSTTLASNFVNAKYATVVCIHSLNDLNDVQQVCKTIDTQTIIYFVKLSNHLQQHNLGNWLLRIFVLPPKDNLNEIKTKWQFSPLKLQVINNEKNIEAFLATQHISYTIL